MSDKGVPRVYCMLRSSEAFDREPANEYFLSLRYTSNCKCGGRCVIPYLSQHRGYVSLASIYLKNNSTVDSRDRLFWGKFFTEHPDELLYAFSGFRKYPNFAGWLDKERITIPEYGGLIVGYNLFDPFTLEYAPGLVEYIENDKIDRVYQNVVSSSNITGEYNNARRKLLEHKTRVKLLGFVPRTDRYVGGWDTK